MQKNTVREPDDSSKFVFGRFSIQPAARQLLVDGKPAKLGARAFDVLWVLIQNRDRVVSRSELFDRVWPGQVVEDNNLTVQVSALRKLLGPEAIVNVPGRGYRFTAAAQDVAAPGAREAVRPGDPVPARAPGDVAAPELLHAQALNVRASAADTGNPDSKGSNGNRRLWLALAATILLVLGYFGVARLPGRGADAPNPGSANPGVPEHSIAVLPFLDMSEKKDQEYFADGLSEELLNLLSRVPGLHVVARTSAFSFKGKSDDIPTIARKLAVANVLEGSVRKSGNDLRITVQLVRADNGYHLWSQTYDRKVDDILKVQDEIAGSVVQTLKVSMLEGALPQAQGSRSAEAYTLLLRARSVAQHAGPPADYEKIVSYLRQALQLDPDYAPAWAALSSALSSQASFGYVPAARGWSDARAAAQRAMALDPALPEGHAALAKILYLHDWDWTGAQAQIQEALRRDPSSSTLAWAAYLSAALGQLDTSIDFLQRHVADDPLDPHAYAYLGVIRYRAGNLAGARAALDIALDLNPAESGAHAAIGVALLAGGDPAAALVEIGRERDGERRAFAEALVYHAMGRQADADAALARLEAEHGQVDAYDVAAVHAYRGEIDQAFSWLDRAYRQRDYAITWIASDPLLDSLHKDARYAALLRKLHFAS